MAESLPTAQATDPAIDWLIAQRREDHERLLKLARFVEGLGAEVREHAALLAPGGDAPPAAPPGEPLTIEDAARRQIEKLARLERDFEEHLTTQTRQSQAENAQRDRDRRALSELAQQVEALARSLEGSTSRTAALAEEIRRERENRAPLVQAQEELQRALAALNSRAGVTDEQIRRLGVTQASVEQGYDRQRNDVNRISGAVQILDLRLTRELTELQRGGEESRSLVSEQLKPIGGLVRQVVTLTEQRDATEQRLVQHQLALDSLRDELARVDAISKTDRSAFTRMAEVAEGQARRAEESIASIWQLGERINGLSDQISLVGKDVESQSRRLDELVRRISWVDEERRRLEAELATVINTARVRDAEHVERADRIEGHLTVEVRDLAEQAASRQRLVVDHLRRTVDVLALQLAELESQPD